MPVSPPEKLEYMRLWREARDSFDPEIRRKYMREYMRKRRAENGSIVDAIKSQPCTDCGVRYPPYVMDFDHLPGSAKLGIVAKMKQHARSRLLREISKCDVVCANCHRERTHRRRHERQTA